MSDNKTKKRKSIVLNGVTYPSILAALKATGTRPNTYYCRIERGWTEEEALQGYRNPEQSKINLGMYIRV